MESQPAVKEINGRCRKIADFSSWMSLNFKIVYFLFVIFYFFRYPKPAFDHFVTFFAKTVPYKYIDPAIIRFNDVLSKDILSEILVAHVKESFTYFFLVHMWKSQFVETGFNFPRTKVNQMVAY